MNKIQEEPKTDELMTEENVLEMDFGKLQFTLPKVPKGVNVLELTEE